ncbi:serine/threonine protein kinase [Stigmatella aurantiaca]|uniref:Serine/threonine protein kinase n=1 Tax=Stigmatella aurantiaca (strain DW4/3-1) TaxID=378806 RepID=Q093X8_STIAD|nr:serine/threonine-protein kinase [Stigmatella aurantiaca]ADO69768.1 serine/threonine protein kinase [Stigmatella aurantiaca DW4/3-1]EAU67032.1 putative serine/threonine protein kinase [Stigmatella aurantiaca DW4/3-1]
MTALVVGLPPGAMIDGFKVIKALGDGGFAHVYLVEKNGKQYALKLARHREASGDDKRTHARTLRELGILLLFADHPNIIHTCGHGYVPDKASGNVYLVLDYVDGWTLGEWMERKHPSVHEVLCVFVKIAAALAYIHIRGVLHRDLKWANVLIRKSDGEPIIIDLGCASHALAEDLTDGGLPPGTDRSRAPRQFQFLREHKEEHRARYAFQVSDEIFAYGVMLYDLLTDPRPTEDRPREPLNHNRRTPEPVHKLNPRVPVAVSEWVQSLLARDPSKRPVDTEALRREAAELAAGTSAGYLEPVHLPSEQRQPAPSEAGEPATLEKTKERPWAALRALAGRLHARTVLAGGGLVAAGVAAALALSAGEVPTPAPTSAPRVAPAPVLPPAGPMALLESAAAMSTPAPARAVDRGPAVPADTQKEGSTVTTQKPEAPKQARTSRAEKQPPSAAVCRTLAFLAAVAAGCTGVPIRPEPYQCPERTQKVMSQLGWEAGERFSVALDDRFERDSRAVFRPGAEVVGIVPDTGLAHDRKLAPPGTKFWGRVYVDPQDETAKGRGQPAALLVKYERAKLPGKEEVPVCIIARSGKVYSVDNDGATKAANSGEARVTPFYPYD